MWSFGSGNNKACCILRLNFEKIFATSTCIEHVWLKLKSAWHLSEVRGAPNGWLSLSLSLSTFYALASVPKKENKKVKHGQSEALLPGE